MSLMVPMAMWLSNRCPQGSNPSSSILRNFSRRDASSSSCGIVFGIVHFGNPRYSTVIHFSGQEEIRANGQNWTDQPIADAFPCIRMHTNTPLPKDNIALNGK